MPGAPGGFGAVPGRPPFFLPQTQQAQQAFAVAGVTRDAAGAPLPGCVVTLYETATDIVLAETVSDEAGLYSFGVQPARACYAVAYLPGAPDVAGTTVNTLLAR